jgi:L-serine dehydratase
MFLSIFDIFKIGIGPSSSHTMGPMVAAGRFLDKLRDGRDTIPGSGAPTHLTCTLHGSLAFTGKGHATDRAVTLGLAGFAPATYDAAKADAALAEIRETHQIQAKALGSLIFNPESDLILDRKAALPGHANGMVLRAFDDRNQLTMSETYYSVGGGFVQTERELAQSANDKTPDPVPYPFRNAAEMLGMATTANLSIAQMKRANETAVGNTNLDQGIADIWSVMESCIDTGLALDGILPGGLKVRRRAMAIHASLQRERSLNQQAPHIINFCISTYAMAVN